MEKAPRTRKRYASDECGEDYAGGKGGGEGERPVQAWLSNLHHYAVTGVKAQAFVRGLFYQGARIGTCTNSISILYGYMKRLGRPARLRRFALLSIFYVVVIIVTMV
jgi:hypothetical protein